MQKYFGGEIEMIKKIHVNKYKKMSNLDLEFIKGVNVISGANGTCKTSILHVITNATQSVIIKNNPIIKVIKAINDNLNLKVESLSKGDKVHNSPCGINSGTLLSIEYFNNIPSLSFRKHDSTIVNRYRLIPKYARGTSNSLPKIPVIYLGLHRLLSFGECSDIVRIETINKKLPDSYKTIINEQYKMLTGIDIELDSIAHNSIENIKKRANFKTRVSGIDSNTISAGEDNIYIILTALNSLKYYYESQETQLNIDVESVLLIDELDATIHPSVQVRLLKLFQQYSKDFHIQICFTTHSLSLLEESFEKKCNVIYLVDNITNVVKMESPNIYKIQMHLKGLTSSRIYENKKIPILTEDQEARVFLELILEYFFRNKVSDRFNQVKPFFHFVDCKIGADNLKTLFGDEILLKSTAQLICILDGDKELDLNKNIIKLPGNKSPEQLIFEYSINLMNVVSDTFFSDQYIINKGYSKVYFRDNIKPDIDNIETKIESLTSEGKSVKGVRREMSKKVFNQHIDFFKLLFKHWLNNSLNQVEIDGFYTNLHIMFKKTAPCYMISPDLWSIGEQN